MAAPVAAHPRVARRLSSSTPAGRFLLAAGYPLPADLVERSVSRLGWLALGFAIAHAAVYLTGMFVQPGWIAPSKAPAIYTGSMSTAIAAGLLMTLLVWRRLLPSALLLDLGLLFEVLGGLLISLAENSIPWNPAEPIRGHSSLELWVMFFALVVPSTLGKALLATLATTAMGPLGLSMQVLVMNVHAPEPAQWFTLFSPTLLLAGCAVAISRFLYGLGAQVGKARELGSYQLVERLGRGGMGEVWRAQHRMLARSAAIKLIRPEKLEGDDAVALRKRFEREARATAALHSPHTVALYDFGVSEDGSFYYVMELLDGIDLEAMVERFGRQPAARVVQILRQACDSLAEAHAAGLTHRDIKPGNILCCRLGCNYDFVKVLDFGLVKSTGTKESKLTLEGTAAGTPSYMAPEMALGKAEVDARADLYALGCVGYWLLAGRLVFEADSVMAMAVAHVQTTPVAPSQRDGIEAPPELERVILRCLEKNPDRRPQSARELAALLDAVPLPDRWSGRDAEQWWRQHMPPVALPVTGTETTLA